MRNQFYVIDVEGSTDPELVGPFENEEDREEAARKVYAHQNPGFDGIFWLDIAADGTPTIGAFSNDFFEGEDGDN